MPYYAIDFSYISLGELIQSFFGLVGPVLGLAIAGSIAYLFLRASVKWFGVIK